MQATTPKILEAAFIDAIHAITPSYEHERSQGWHYSEEALEDGIGGKALRDFTLVLGAAVPRSYFHGNGESYEFTMAIRVSYKGVPARELAHMTSADAVDIRGALDDLRDPTVPGLYSITYEGPGADETSDIDAAALEYLFRVVYNQNT